MASRFHKYENRSKRSEKYDFLLAKLKQKSKIDRDLMLAKPNKK